MHLHVSVVVWRGSIAESRHCVQVALSDSDDAVAADRVTTLRSAAKPFQLVPLVERGHAERWGWSDEQIAVMAASHSGSAYHLGLVRGIWRELHGDEKPVLILGAMADKDTTGVAEALAPIASRVCCVTVGNPRSAKAVELAEIVRPFHADVSSHADLAAALASTGENERILIAGSLFLVAEALIHFDLAEPDGRTTVQ